ncbi:MAG TPA: hypothetical protein VFF46_38385, partial [Kribbella sp.]
MRSAPFASSSIRCRRWYSGQSAKYGAASANLYADVDASTSRRTCSGCVSTNCIAARPPVENPTRSTTPSPSRSISRD